MSQGSSHPPHFKFKQPLLTEADRSGKHNYLTIFCLLDLIYDVCYELVVIMEFGSLSETGWGDVFDLASWRILEEKLFAQSCSDSQTRHKRFWVCEGGAAGDPHFPGDTVNRCRPWVPTRTFLSLKCRFWNRPSLCLRCKFSTDTCSSQWYCADKAISWNYDLGSRGIRRLPDS